MEREELSDKEFRVFLDEAEHEREQIRAISEVLRNRKCVPFCLNGNYR